MVWAAVAGFGLFIGVAVFKDLEPMTGIGIAAFAFLALNFWLGMVGGEQERTKRERNERNEARKRAGLPLEPEPNNRNDPNHEINRSRRADRAAELKSAERWDALGEHDRAAQCRRAAERAWPASLP